MVRRNKDKRYLFLGIAIAVILAVALIINSEQIQLGPPLDGELEGLFGNKVYTDLIAALANCEARATAEFIEVSTCEGLKGIDNNLRKNYRLMNDLTCNFEPIAFGAGDFKGIFDGQNHTVNYEYTSDSRGKVGLFSDVGECGIIKNLHVDANVKGTSRVGSIAGYVYKGILKEVYATGNVEATAEAVGGLVGGLESGGIIDSYSEVSVQGTEKVGGLVGAMWKSLNEEQTPIVKNTYANGKVIAGGAQAGGLIGLCDYQPMSSYWNLDVYSGDNGCGVGKTDVEMKRQATFVGWNFAKTWRIDESVDYPRLRWQEEDDCPSNSLVGFYWNSSDEQEEMRLIDIYTGNSSLIGLVDELKYYAYTATVYNPNTREYYIGGYTEDSSNYYLFKINAFSGESERVFIKNDSLVNYIHFHIRSDGKLLSFHWNGNIEREFLASIDIGSGIPTMVGPIYNLRGLTIGHYPIDNSKNIIYQHGDNRQSSSFIWKVDSFNASYATFIPDRGGYYSLHVRRDGSLVGFSWNVENSRMELRKINTDNGQSELIGIVPGMNSLDQFTATATFYDSRCNIIYQRGTDLELNETIFMVNADNPANTLSFKPDKASPERGFDILFVR